MGKGKGRSTGDSEDMESEEVEKLAGLRSAIRERINKLEVELDEWKTILDVLDQHLTQVSFKKAAMPETPRSEEVAQAKPSREPSGVQFEYGREVSLKSTAGTLLAKLQIGSEALRVVLAKDTNLKTSIPPFESFLVNRIFNEMIKSDEEDVRNNKISPNQRLSYKVEESGDGTIAEIRINNYGTDRRLRELRTSIRWTLEKMYEKVSQG